jgi:hypothetical protein
MKTFLPPRLRRPAVEALAGTGLTVAVASRAAWWWPCAAIFALAVFAYLYGLSRFGVGEEGPGEDDDADSGYEARSPVTS